MRIKRFGVGGAVAAIALVAGVALIRAQPLPTPEATPRPVDLTCELDDLRTQQSELAARLADFDSAAESNAGAALDALFKVGEAYQQLALDCGYIPADVATRTVGTDVERILTLLDEVSGDPINGQLLYNGELACAGCHSAEAGGIAPPTEGTYTRAEETRLQDPALEGYTVEHYFVESILLPGSYLAPGYTNIMLPNFGDRITLQDLADLLAFLESQDGPSPE